MTEPAALAATLRTLADLIDSGAPVTIDVEPEVIGRAAKTTVTVWALEQPPAPPEPQWCERLIPEYSRPDRLCRQMLRPDGTCPREHEHRRAVRW